MEQFGRVDILCNNAGVGLLRSVTETEREDYDRVFDTNVWGMFTCSRFAIPRMIEGGGGSVVNVGSVAATVGFASDAAYCASKGAVHSLTRQMALDYAESGVRVNCVAPGFIETEQVRVYLASHDDPVAAEREVVASHPLRRMGRPAGGRRGRRLSRLGRRLVRHRRLVHRRRRSARVVSEPAAAEEGA